MLDLYESSQKIDQVVLGQKLIELGLEDVSGGFYYLADFYYLMILNYMLSN